MSLLLMVVIIVAAVLLLTSAFFFYPWKVETRSQELAGTVSCKKCGARIAVSNPSKLHLEFSVKCTACETRKLYKLVDLTR
jgi:P pilus assembly chaperone PapD